MPECSRIDALATPFVDGELPPAEQASVTAHLTQCPPCQARIATERAIRRLLEARRADLVSAAAPADLKARCARLGGAGTVTPFPVHASAPRRSGLAAWRARYAPLAVAASILLAVAGAFLYQATRSSSRVLAAELALDHEKCFRLNRLLGTQHSRGQVEQTMSSWFGWQVDLPNGNEEMTLEGSRPCLTAEGKVAHIMYRHHGQPVSLFMLPHDARPEQVVEVFGNRARIWSSGARTFVLVAREPEPELERMVALVRTTVR